MIKKNIYFKIINFLFIFLIIFVPLFYTEKVLDPVLIIKYIGFSMVILIFAILIFLKIGKKKLNLNFFNFFFIIYFLYFLQSALSLFYTSNFADGLFEVSKIFLSFIFIFFINFFFQNKKDIFIEIVSKSFAIFSNIIIIIGLFQLFQLLKTSGISHQNMYEIKGVFAHKNIFSEILLITFPFSIFNIISYKKFWKILSFFNAFAIIFLITILLTRAVWVSFAGSFFVTGILIIFFIKKKHFFSKKKFGIGILIFIISIILGITFYSQQDSFETFKKQNEKITNFNYGSVMDRLELWKRTFNIFEENKILGKGIASWKTEVLKFGSKNLKSDDELTFYQRPHNDFLWVLSEQGIIGFLLFLMIFLNAYFYIFKTLKKFENKKEFLFSMVLFFSLNAYLLFSIFSFPKERIEHLIFISVIFSGINILYNEKYNKNNFPIKKLYSKSALLLLIIILLFVNFLGIKRFQSENKMKEIYIAKGKSEWNKIISLSKEIEKEFYNLDVFSTPVFWYEGISYFNLKNYNKSLESFLKSYESNPYHIHVLNNLGSCYEILKKHKKAIEFYKKAIKIDKNFEDAILNIAVSYHSINDLENSYKNLQKININTKNLRFKKYVIFFIKKIIEKEKKKYKEKIILDILDRFLYSEKWLLDIHNKSVKEKITIEKQIFEDVIYMIFESDKVINKKYKEEIISKYKIKKY